MGLDTKKDNIKSAVLVQNDSTFIMSLWWTGRLLMNINVLSGLDELVEE